MFILAVAAACTLAGAKTYREIGDHAADLPQSVLRDLGGKRHLLKREITAPSETRIRTLLHGGITAGGQERDGQAMTMSDAAQATGPSRREMREPGGQFLRPPTPGHPS